MKGLILVENLEMIHVGENGQLYIDFDALEAITSTEFVEQVKRDAERSILSARVDVDPGYYVVVHLFNDLGFFIQHTFSIRTGRMDRKLISLHDFDTMSEMLQEARRQ